MKILYSRFITISCAVVGIICGILTVYFWWGFITDPNQEIWTGKLPLVEYFSWIFVLFVCLFSTYAAWGACFSYTKIDEKGVSSVIGIAWWKKKSLAWEDIKEVGIGMMPLTLNGKMVYFSPRPLTIAEMQWVANVKDAITVVDQKKVRRALKQYMPKNLTLISVNGKEEI